MKAKLTFLIIILIISTQLSAQQARWENITDELISRLQQVSKEAPDTERQILEALRELGFDTVSPAEVRELEHLLRQQLPAAMLKRHLMRLQSKNCLPKSGTNVSPINSAPITKANDQPLNAAERVAIEQVLEDFQVNDNQGRCGHYAPAVAVDSSSNFVVTWCDNRNGYYDIYAQRYDRNGNKLGENMRVNDFEKSMWTIFPSIAIDRKGNFVITWGDVRRGDNKDIYAQRFSSDGSKQGVNFRVNDQDGSLRNGSAVCIDGSGNFVITWQDRRNGDDDIYAQRYNNNGTKRGVNFRVNDDSGNEWQAHPGIAADSSGNFMITWRDERNGNYDIYAQQYNNNGIRQDMNFRVNDDTGNSNQYEPAIASNGSGNFVVTWQDYRDSYYANIFAQRFSSDGTRQGVNFQVNDDTGRNSHNDPSIAVDQSGAFIITWWDNRDWDYNIYAQQYSSEGSSKGGNFQVNDDEPENWHYYPSIAADDSGNFVITWADTRNGNSDIYAQRYKNDGNQQQVNFRVNDDEGSSNQYKPRIDVDGSGNFVITWQDDRHGGYNIFAQRFSNDGARQDINFQVNDDEESSNKYAPAIAMDADGNFVITWYTNGFEWDPDVYAQRYSNNGLKLGSNFKVNDNVGYSRQVYPVIAVDSNGNFIITWHDNRNGNFDIYAQRYDKNGNKQGVNFQVNDDVGTSGQSKPDISMDGSGNFVITWQDGRKGNYDYDIYAQRYSSDGSTQGVNFKVNDDGGDRRQWSPTIGADDSGNFVITWEDDRNSLYSDIYAQCYNSDGSKQGVNFRVSDNGENSDQSYPAIAVDSNGDFVITWEDYRNGNADIYAQRYSKAGAPISSNYRVNNDTGFKLQASPDVSQVDRYIYYTWEDNRITGQGYDIFARVDLANFSPTAPTLLSPENNIILNNDKPMFEFTVPLDVNNDSLHFKVEIATDNSFTSQISGSPYESKNNVAGFSPVPPLHQGTGTCSFTLSDTLTDGDYFWRVTAWDGQVYGTTSVIWKFTIAPTLVDNVKPHLPEQYELLPNYPNPFNTQTIISYALPQPDQVQLQIFNINGRKVKGLVNSFQGAGFHSVSWNGEDEARNKVTSGIYIYQLKTRSVVLQQKLIIAK